MCMSPDEMSDDRIREVAEYYRGAEQAYIAEGNEREARYFAAQAGNFEALLAEREAARAADMEEVFAAVVVEESVPQRELVAV